MRSDTQREDQPSPSAKVLHMLEGHRVTQAIYVAAALGIADLLKDGPKSSDHLASSTGAHPSALFRVLRALASLGILVREEDGRFGLTPLGEPLQTDAFDSVRATAIMWGEETVWRPWGDLLYSVKTGKPAFDNLFGMRMFDYYTQGDDQIVNEAMTGGANRLSSDVVDAYDFSGVSRIVDVGGGHGALIATILKSYPQMRGILFDLPKTVEGARRRIDADGVADRCELIGGDFFDAVPAGGDAYMLCRVVHDWEYDRALALLKNCRRSMADGSRLLLVERASPADETDSSLALRDLNLLVMAASLQRTEVEFRELFDAADIKLTNVIPTRSEWSVIEGVPV